MATPLITNTGPFYYSYHRLSDLYLPITHQIPREAIPQSCSSYQFFGSINANYFEGPAEFTDFLVKNVRAYKYQIRTNLTKYTLSEESLIAIAKECIKHGQIRIDDFNKISPKTRREILILAARQNRLENWSEVNPSWFVDMKDFVDFLHLYANDTNATQLAAIIRKFNVPQEYRVALATKVASNTNFLIPEEIRFNINEYGIEDYHEWLKILKIAVEKRTLATSFFNTIIMDTFESDNDLLDFIFRASNKYPFEVLSLLEKTENFSKEEKEKILTELLMQIHVFEALIQSTNWVDPFKTISLSKEARQKVFDHYIITCITTPQYNVNFFNRNYCPKFVDCFEKDQENLFFQDLFKYVKELSEPLQQELVIYLRIMNIFMHGVTRLYQNKGLDPQIRAIENICRQIIKLRNPPARTAILQALTSLVLSQEKLENWYRASCNDEINPSGPKRSKKKKVLHAHALIPSILAFQMIEHDGATISLFIQELFKERLYFRGAQYHHSKLLVNFLVLLKNAQLDQTQCRLMITQIFSCNDSGMRFAKRLRLLTTFLLLKRLSVIAIEKPITNETMQQLLIQQTCKLFGLDPTDFGGPEEFAKRYAKHFQDKTRLREEEAWFIYQANMSNIIDEDDRDLMITAISKVITVILQDKYDDWRKESPQLQVISKIPGGKDLVEDWCNPPPFARLNLFLPPELAGKPEYKGLKIGVTKESGDIILLGNETGGCLAVYKDSNYSRCALGYMDGKYAVVAIRGEDDRLITRTIMRLTIDTKTNRPAILLESKTYSLIDNKVFNDALEKYAIAYAENLGIPLYSVKKDKYPEAEGVVLISQGCITPFELSDALEEYIEAGKAFEFEEDLHLMYAPPTRS